MPSPLSVNLRKRVVAAVAAGASCHRAAARFGVSVLSASRWSQRCLTSQPRWTRVSVPERLKSSDDGQL
jgi:transposase